MEPFVPLVLILLLLTTTSRRLRRLWSRRC